MQYNRNLYVFYLFEAVKRQKKFLKFTEKTPHTSVAYILDTWRDSDYFFHDISLCNCCFFRTTFTLLLQCKGYSQRKSIEMRHFFEKNCSLVLPCIIQLIFSEIGPNSHPKILMPFIFLTTYIKNQRIRLFSFHLNELLKGKLHN